VSFGAALPSWHLLRYCHRARISYPAYPITLRTRLPAARSHANPTSVRCFGFIHPSIPTCVPVCAPTFVEILRFCRRRKGRHCPTPTGSLATYLCNPSRRQKTRPSHSPSSRFVTIRSCDFPAIASFRPLRLLLPFFIAAPCVAIPCTRSPSANIFPRLISRCFLQGTL
jgi:hypothetical protein